MILLLGGTSESLPIARGLAGQGVVVSTLTNLQREALAGVAGVSVRNGRFDEASLKAFVQENDIHYVVDATHPYAEEISALAVKVCDMMGVPLIAYIRPPSVTGNEDFVHMVGSHEEAADVAFAVGNPVLLTTGSRNLSPYVEKAGDVPLYARILPVTESMDACKMAGIAAAHVIAKQGPFTVGQNVAHIRQYGIGVIVTKDGGAAGGMPEKIEAARSEGCRLVVVMRPSHPATCRVGSVDEAIRRAGG